MCENEHEAGAGARVMKKESSGTTLMKTMISGAVAVFMNRRAPEPELCHFYDSSAAL